MRRLAAVQRGLRTDDAARADQLAAHLREGCAPLYTVLRRRAAAGAGSRRCDPRRGARRRLHRAQGVHASAGAHFDWSGAARRVAGDEPVRRPPADRDPHSRRGKPGKDGSEALQRYCETPAGRRRASRWCSCRGWTASSSRAPGSPRSTRAGVTVRVDPVERKALPQWIAQRLAAQGQRVRGGEAGQRTLAFFADRVEGNLLAAHQELQKLALLYPPGELSFEQVEAAVLNVARYDVFKLGEAVLAGQVARALRMLDGLRAEGEAAVLVHWTLAEDIRALKRVQGRGRPAASRCRWRCARRACWGAKEQLFERAAAAAERAGAGAVGRGRAGLRRPGQGPASTPTGRLDAWDGLKRLVLMAVRTDRRARHQADRGGHGADGVRADARSCRCTLLRRRVNERRRHQRSRSIASRKRSRARAAPICSRIAARSPVELQQLPARHASPRRRDASQTVPTGLPGRARRRGRRCR